MSPPETSTLWLDLMAQAAAEAEKGLLAGHGGPFGALVVRGNHILGLAHNEVLSSQDPSAHAEVLAIRRASAALATPHLGETVLITSCEPCPMCLATALWARIPLILYGCTRDDAAAIGFDDSLFHRHLVWTPDPAAPLLELRNLGRELCLPVFRLWSERSQSRLY